MATIADFKRKAVKGAEIRGGYFWKLGLGSSDISQCNWRKITGSQSNGLRIEGSFLDYPKASLATFDGRTLKIYKPGYRKMNEQELAAMREWQKITETEEYEKQAYYDAMTDTSLCYWKGKAFFEERGLDYLYFGEKAGLTLDHNKFKLWNYDAECIRDDKIRGEQIAEYELKGES